MASATYETFDPYGGSHEDEWCGLYLSAYENKWNLRRILDNTVGLRPHKIYLKLLEKEQLRLDPRPIDYQFRFADSKFAHVHKGDSAGAAKVAAITLQKDQDRQIIFEKHQESPSDGVSGTKDSILTSLWADYGTALILKNDKRYEGTFFPFDLRIPFPSAWQSGLMLEDNQESRNAGSGGEGIVVKMEWKFEWEEQIEPLELVDLSTGKTWAKVDDTQMAHTLRAVLNETLRSYLSDHGYTQDAATAQANAWAKEVFLKVERDILVTAGAALYGLGTNYGERLWEATLGDTEEGRRTDSWRKITPERMVEIQELLRKM